MIPKAEEALSLLSKGLMTTLLSEPHSVYAISDVSFIALLLNTLGQEYNKGAEVRVRDIEEMQQLFKDAVAKVADAALNQNLVANLSEQSGSLQIADLNRFHDRCSLLLIELHLYVEEQMFTVKQQNPDAVDGVAASWAESCNSDIWDFLERQAERHKIDLMI